ncbi:unnamed protein product [Clonostachys rhizophaga]|uniref:Major facilitator superfamily (MFS) profile domain-containing protein n=1 Tax=Clonostachys rhizophaga TaxID=160324 RepID=A0A9N9YIY7_9HYPO|nr:unnamed protein product [Clonostachys rhizophaga]
MSNNQVHDENILGSAMSSEKHPPPGQVSSSEAPKRVSEVATGENQEAAPRENTLPILNLILIGAALWFSIFLITLDGTIVANAIPTITDEFHKISDVGWYGSAYLLTQAAFQLLYGKIYAKFSIKYTFIAAISVFELGSLVCALAPNSTALIIGRAVSGFGGAGITSGSMAIIAYSVPLRLRPLFIASFGIVFAVSSVCGPLLGGVFTSKLTWRWCFYINLPFGGFTILAILLVLREPKRPELDSIALGKKLQSIDFLGTLLLVPAIVCLLLALQWGGSKYSWSNARIIALLVLFGLLSAAFIAFQHWKGEEATLVLRLLASRSVLAASWYGFCNGGAMTLLVYYIPFWHQVIHGVSAVDSGIRLLPFMIGVVITVMLAGAIVSKFGYYTIFLILSSIITPIGEGLLTTWKVDTGFSEWVGYQALIGLGIGLGQQQPLVAIQNVVPKAEIASGTAIVMLVQLLSGSIFVSVGQAVLQNKLVENLAKAFSDRGDFDPSQIANAGATDVLSIVPADDLPAVLEAYNRALVQVYTVALVLSALTIFGSVAMEWKSVKKEGDKPSEEGSSEK